MEKSSVRSLILQLAVILSMTAAAVYSFNISLGIKTAALACINTMIPSLFAMMICTELFMSCGLHLKAAKLINKPSQLLLKCSGEIPVIFLVSQISGYPIGAKMLSVLVKENRLSKRKASLLSGCCFGCGPAFLGALFTESHHVFLVFSACFISNLLLFLICAGVKNKNVPRGTFSETQPPNVSLVKATVSAGVSMLKICAMVLMFGGIFGIISALDIDSLIGNRFGNIIYGFLEISRITEFTANTEAFLPILGAMLSFGGVCVLMQINAVADGYINIWYTAVFRLISCGITYIILKIICFYSGTNEMSAVYTQAVFSVPETISAAAPLPSVLLLIMSFMLLGYNMGD